jgi:hypothetical protein
MRYLPVFFAALACLTGLVHAYVARSRIITALFVSSTDIPRVL